MTTISTRIGPPIDLQKWIDANRQDLKPPVGNKYLVQGPNYFVMISGGPNARNDFHINNTEEWFHQLEGDIFVRIRDEDGEIKDVLIREGETWMCPPRVPHSPQRPPGTVGLIVECQRPEGDLDKQVFYCANCGELVYESVFQLKDIVSHFKQMMEEFWSDDEKRTCSNCGTKVEQPQPRQSLTEPWGMEGEVVKGELQV